MNKKNLILLSLIFFGAMGCVRHLRDVAKYTYPPDFKYIEKKQLSSSMWKLAFASQSLNRALEKGDQEQKPFEYQNIILTHLTNMDSAARSLKAEGQNTNHPMLNQNLPLLLQDLELAKRAASLTPPNYVPSGQVASACRYCHGK